MGSRRPEVGSVRPRPRNPRGYVSVPRSPSTNTGSPLKVHVCQFAGTTHLQGLPLAAGLLVASARANPALADRVDLTVHATRPPVADAVQALEGADVVALSLYTWNLAYSLEVARAARAEGVPVVVGGPSVPRDADAVAAFLDAHPQVDVLVLGEGEATFQEVLDALADGRPVAGLAGTATRGDDGPVLGPPRARSTTFEHSASPYLDGTFDTLLADGLTVNMAAIETNRGCPFRCTFCDWGQATASAVHELPADRVQAEFDWIGAHGIDAVYLVDANFGIRPRDADLLHHLAAVKGRTGHPASCFFHLTKNARERNLDTVRILAGAGIDCRMALSMQDLDERVLHAIQRDNIRVERALALREACHDAGIPTFNELILGLPEQTLDSFAASLTTALTPFPGDALQIYLCRLLPNTELASPAHRDRFGLQTVTCAVRPADPDVDDHVVETEELVVGTAAMPPDDWARAYRLANLLTCLLHPSIAWRELTTLAFEHRVDLVPWFHVLEAHLQVAPAGSRLAAVHDVLERHVHAVRTGEGERLEHADLPGRRWTVGEALHLVVGRDVPAVRAELRAVVPAWPDTTR